MHAVNSQCEPEFPALFDHAKCRTDRNGGRGFGEGGRSSDEMHKRRSRNVAAAVNREAKVASGDMIARVCVHLSPSYSALCFRIVNDVYIYLAGFGQVDSSVYHPSVVSAAFVCCVSDEPRRSPL